MFKPVNRYIHVHVPDEGPTERASGIVLPEDYNPEQARHIPVTVKGWADDVRFATELLPDCRILIDRSMVEDIIIKNEKITVILDNYVIGIF